MGLPFKGIENFQKDSPSQKSDAYKKLSVSSFICCGQMTKIGTKLGVFEKPRNKKHFWSQNFRTAPLGDTPTSRHSGS